MYRVYYYVYIRLLTLIYRVGNKILPCDKREELYFWYMLHRDDDGFMSKGEGKKFSIAYVHIMSCSRLGNLIVAWLGWRKEIHKREQNGILDLFILASENRINQRVINIIANDVHIFNGHEIYWRKVLKNIPEVRFDRNNMFGNLNLSIDVSPRETEELFKLTMVEERMGADRYRELGPYVCMSNRDKEYFLMHNSNDDKHRYRDSNFENWIGAISYLSTCGIKSVRMGIKNQQCKFDNIDYIDYTIETQNDVYDLWLFAHCKFYIGDSHGIIELPMCYNKPVCIVNLVNYLLLPQFAGSPTRDDMLYIIKKYRCSRTGRFLNLKEMAYVDSYILKRSKSAAIETAWFKKIGIEIVDNSDDEIENICREMNEKLDGVHEYDSVTELLREEYYRIASSIYVNATNIDNLIGFPKGNISGYFIRKNKYLLDGENNYRICEE